MGGWKDRSFIQYKSSEIIIEMTPLQQTPPPLPNKTTVHNTKMMNLK